MSLLKVPHELRATSYAEGHVVEDFAARCVCAIIRPLHASVAAPSFLYLAALSIMLFRPPDVSFYHLDRVAFAAVVFFVSLRTFLLRQRMPWYGMLSWSMLGLLLLAIGGTLSQPFDAVTWSVLSAKFLVPFTLFHIAGLVFTEERFYRHLQLFCLSVLIYLSWLAVASFAGANALIFPRYILDESLGTHIHRARGPFLQAVANGVTLNILGLLALYTFSRERLAKPLAFIVLTGLPLAILATMTRAVWLSFGASLFLMMMTLKSRMRRYAACLLVLGIAAVLGSLLFSSVRDGLGDRLQERGPLEIRMAIYRASWEMIQEKPWLGWGQNHMAAEVGRRLPDYRLDAFAAHNNYLEILVEHGGVGLALYAVIIVALFRLGFHEYGGGLSFDSIFHNDFRTVWLVILGVYLFNGCFVVMNYQFVNALLFTVAGVLCAQHWKFSEFSR